MNPPVHDALSLLIPTFNKESPSIYPVRLAGSELGMTSFDLIQLVGELEESLVACGVDS